MQGVIRKGDNSKMSKEQCLTRKFRLMAEGIEPKTWVYYLESQIRKEQYKKAKVETSITALKEKNPANMEKKLADLEAEMAKYDAKIADLGIELEETNRKIQAKEPFEFTRKQISDAVYTYLRDCLYNQNKAMNICMTNLYAAEILGFTADEKKELHRVIGRNPDSKLGSAYGEDNAELQKLFGDKFERMATAKYRENLIFPSGLSMASRVERKCGDIFSTKYTDILSGKCVLPTFRSDNPIFVLGKFLKPTESGTTTGFYHTYEDDIALTDALNANGSLDIFIKFVMGITFRVNMGTANRNEELKTTILRIFDGTYSVCDSTMQLDGTKIILNLALKMPKANIQLNPDVVVGVDLGLAVPATIALNTNPNIIMSIGSYDDFLRIRTQLKAQRRRLQSSLKMTTGGHGRTKKLKALDKFKTRERNFVKSYNHMISKQVIDFAVKNKAGQINIENISGFGMSVNEDENKKRVLANWSYYELQEMISYKAEKYGIVVKKVNPCYTSQVCSICGTLGERVDQKTFNCVNPKCKANKMKDYLMNADVNAARNIAKSTLYDDKTHSKQDEIGKMVMTAREYYGITVGDFVEEEEAV